jgi:UDP-GlcNAc:undecaprenyl-phosphate GlcNAc-1-phosphate transferase
MWINNLFCLILSAVFCLMLTPVFRSLGSKMHIYSIPGGRHVNKSPVPRLGGAAVFISFLLTLCVVFYARDFFNLNLPRAAMQSLLFPLLCGAACVWLLGLLDDIRHIRARYKLLAQIAVAAGVYSMGLQIHAINFPILGVLDLGDYSLPFTVFWIVGTINAVNLIDGIDGLCSSVVICALLGISCLAMFSGVGIGAIICFALMGCMLAFLIFNSPPASIFLGDSGAYFLGFMIAALPIFIASRSYSTGVFHVAFIVFLIVPFLDTGLAILRRMIMSVPMATPDRGHLHHRLLDNGYTYIKTTATISFVSLVLAIVGVTVAIGNFWQTAVALLIGVSTVCFLLYLCGISSVKNLKPKHMTSVTKAGLLKEYTPAFFHDITGAADWTKAQEILDNFSRNTEMCAANIVCLKNGSHSVVWDWRNKLSSPGRRKPQLCKTYKVFHDDSCYQFYYCWDSEYNQMQNDTDALLEVISKTVGKSCHEKFFSSNITFEKSESFLSSRSGLRLASGGSNRAD